MGDDKITVYSGNDVTLTLTFTDANGDPLDITGYTVFFTVKDNYTQQDDKAFVAEEVTSHTNPTGGITTISISRTNLNRRPGVYVYDIQTKDTGANISTVTSDDFEILPKSTSANS